MKWALGALVLVVVAVTTAAFLVPADAASVNGDGITRATLDADLSAIAGSTAYQCYLGADLDLTGQPTTGLFPVEGAGASASGPADYSAAFAGHWLSQLMSDELVDQAVAARHLSVTPADVALGRATLEEQIGEVFSTLESSSGETCDATSTTLLAALPQSFVDGLVQAQAEQDVLLAHEAGYGLGTPSLLRYYSGHRASFDTICVSYVAFASETDAAQAQAKVAAGTAFSSTGQVTALGCGVRATITSLPSSVTSLPVGQVSQPVAAGNGEYALLEVTSVKGSTFTSVESDVGQVLLGAGSARTTALLEAAGRRAQVTVDPRYGQVVPHSIVLSVPESPPLTTLLNPSANASG